jgi:L-ornithine Nalpha-acyltransferase
MLSLRKGRYVARFAESEHDLRRAQRLRHLAFIASRPGAAPRPDGLDSDGYDAHCRHVLVEERRSGTLVCCFRLMPLHDGSEIGRSYSAQFYELSALSSYPGRLAEMGRFCIHPDWKDPNILRVAWAAMARYVDAEGVELLFGCSSFQGIEAESYMDAFALLKERHLAPRRWLPRVKAPRVFRFARQLRWRKPEPRRAMLGMPPLLRSYLALGGWVSDHAVVDPDLNTLHVFTGLEISAIPPSRARLLRATAAA